MIIKKESFIQILFFSFILPCAISCNNTPSQKDNIEEQIIKRLKDFYISYVTENFKRPPYRNQLKVDSIQLKYCKEELLHMFDDSIDYDPFTSAQMFDLQNLKTLSIRRDVKQNGIYYVSHIYYVPIIGNRYEKYLSTVKVRVTKINGEYKIDHIFLEDHTEKKLTN